MPGWIPDVVSHTTIRSVWGNTVRDQVVQSFVSRADLNVNAVPREGMVAWCAAEATLLVRKGGAWLTVTEPYVTFPAPVFGIGSTGNYVATGPWKYKAQRDGNTIRAIIDVDYNGQVGSPQSAEPVGIALPYGANIAGRVTAVGAGWISDYKGRGFQGGTAAINQQGYLVILRPDGSQAGCGLGGDQTASFSFLATATYEAASATP